MTNQNKSATVTTPVKAAKPPKKLIPRTAPKREVPAESTVAEESPVERSEGSVVTEAVLPATAAATRKARPARKPTREDEVVARHQKVLAEALAMAQGINYTQPLVMRQESAKGKKAAKQAKPVKAKKPKLVRDSYAMPEAEYAQIGELKKRLAALGGEVKKSELLRAGIAVMATLSDVELKAVMARVERLKTGRPAK